MNVRPKERTEMLTMRVTPAEKEALQAAAVAAGLSVTAFLLGCALGDKVGQMLIDGFSDKGKW